MQVKFKISALAYNSKGPSVDVSAVQEPATVDSTNILVINIAPASAKKLYVGQIVNLTLEFVP